MTNTSHIFRADVYTPERDQPLTLVDIVRQAHKSENLVVVAGAGGGILAAGWLTSVLDYMVADCPALRRDIRLLSTVSGSSTGAAFYLDSLLRYGVTADASPTQVQAALAKAAEASVASSLKYATYGITLLDFWRFASGGLLPPRWLTEEDRGTYLQRGWLANAKTLSMGQKDPGEVSLSALRSYIASGDLPAVIFNSTIMEAGRRVMMTPIDFAKADAASSTKRGDLLSEFYELSEGRRVDLSIWTAARMSATFLYVTPAAKAKFAAGLDGGCYVRAYHLIDGGYYDNYGVASALDWLEPVLQARLHAIEAAASGTSRLDGELLDTEFKRVLILQLRAFKVSELGNKPPVGDALTALAGPLFGVMNVYSGAAVTGNEISLHRFIEGWNAHLQPHVEIKTVKLERAYESGPLSWRLTSRQIEELKQSFQPDNPLVQDR